MSSGQHLAPLFFIFGALGDLKIGYILACVLQFSA
jgi:hypothetical protein